MSTPEDTPLSASEGPHDDMLKRHRVALEVIESLGDRTDIENPEEIQIILMRSWVLGEDTSEGVDLDDETDKPKALYVPEEWGDDPK